MEAIILINAHRQRIEYLRSKGESYAAIADSLGISVNTVKSHCRRNNFGAGSIDNPVNTCDNCGKSLIHTPGSKRKRFCSDKCRMAWWAKHPDAVNRKAIYHFTCAVCGTSFESYGNARRKYCSKACFGMSKRVCHE